MQRRITSKLVVFTIITLITSVTMTSTTNSNVYSYSNYNTNSIGVTDSLKNSPINDSFLQRPIMSIEKTVNSTVINPENDAWIRVNITITNLGNATAYNLTTIDPGFEDWALTSLNLTEQKWVIIDVNASAFYFYYFKPIIEGNFTLEPTDIVYVDINGTEYHAQSNRFVIISIKPSSIEIIDTELWLNILYYSLIIAGALSAIVIFDFFVIKRSKEVKKVKTKAKDKKGATSQKSKKQIKRKTKKRR